MSNVEKLMDALINWNAQKLIVNCKEPAYLIKDKQKTNLLKNILNTEQFDRILNEYKEIFNNKKSLYYRDNYIDVLIEDSQISFEQKNDNMSIPKIDKNKKHTNNQSKDNKNSKAEKEAESIFDKQYDSVDIIELLKKMDKYGASDLHLSTGSNPFMRIDGDIVRLDNYPLIEENKLLAEIEKITPEVNLNEFNKTNDTDFAYEIKDYARYRANIFMDNNGVGMVFRIIPSKILTVEDLSIPSAMVKLCDIPKGLILITGPTGSGKSTTLAALIDYINTNHKKHIITVEDPVEFVHQNKSSLLNQREINTHTQSFKSALRAALREDPDIILVGELRDLETIAIAIEMAVTGHLVFGTLHTSTAIATIDRIIDQFPADRQSQIRTMLSDSLLGVCSQNLLKRKTGGRVGAYEVLISTIGVANLIREGKNFQIATMMQTGKNIGMQMLNNVLFELVESDTVEAEEAILKALDKESLINMLKTKKLYT